VLIGAPLTFIVYFIGTVLPTMVLIYAILLPRYLRLTGSAIAPYCSAALPTRGCILSKGGQCLIRRGHRTFAHFRVAPVFRAWDVKSVLTLRTGNAWVHALSYHAVAPHVIIDTPLMVKVLASLDSDKIAGCFDGWCQVLLLRCQRTNDERCHQRNREKYGVRGATTMNFVNGSSRRCP